MCPQVCLDVLDSCGSLLTAQDDESAVYFYDQLEACAGNTVQTCAYGLDDVYFSRDEPQCFHSTVAPERPSC
jgi:hypothetical protein